MLQTTLNDWNPWWKEKKVRVELIGIERKKTRILNKAIKEKEILVLTGPRRSGKTTIMHQLINNLLEKGIKPEQVIYINLDDESLIETSLETIYLTYRKNKNPNDKVYFFIDEVQEKENWEKFLKKKYDMREDIKFVISGSNANLLNQDYSRLLTGRIIRFEIFPLDFIEFLNFKGFEYLRAEEMDSSDKWKLLRHFDEYLNFGGYPEIVNKDRYFKNVTLKDYYEGSLYRDIIGRYALNSEKFAKLAHYLITNFTCLVSYRDLMRRLELTYSTLINYLGYLREAYLIYEINYFAFSLKRQEINNKKIFCIDNGLRNAVSFKFSEDKGKLAENLVFIELKRREYELYYWQGKGEVDFVVKNKDNSLTAINVTYSDEINDRETRALLEFKKEFKQTKELILLTRDTEKKQQGIRFIPLWKWLL